MMKNKRSILSRAPVVMSVALLCCMLWGSAFAGVKTGYAQMGIAAADWASQMVFAGVRFALAGVMVLTAGSVLAKSVLLPRRSAIPRFLCISLFQTILQYFFYYIGLAHTTGVKAAVIVGANVFTAILISALLYQTEPLTARKLIGCCVGFGGIVLINLSGLQGGMHLNLSGDGCIFLCTVASGFSSVLMKKYSATENPVLLSGWQFFVGGLVMWGIGAAAGGTIGHLTPAAAAILLYLSFVSAAAYTLWSLLLQNNPVSRVAVFGFMNPICGVIISSLVLHEHDMLGLRALAALALVCAGIYIVNRQTAED